MYLWIVIATFIVALFSYNLSVHPDVDRMYAQTRANTVAASFQIQHNALVAYVKSLEGHTTEQQFTQDADGNINVSGGAYQSGAYFFIAGTEGKNFSTGWIADVSIEGINSFLPPGFELDGRTISKIYCFKRYDTPTAPTENQEGATVTKEQILSGEQIDPVTGKYAFNYEHADAPCTQENKVVLVSWRKIPQKWINHVNTSLPTPDMMHAIARSNGYGTTFGYTIHSESNQNDYFISGAGKKIYEAVATDTQTPNIKDTCGDEPCFVSVSQIKY